MPRPGERRPRVLVLTARLPLPPRSGGDLRVLGTVSGLARFARVAVFGLDPGTRATPPGVEIWRGSADRSVTDPRAVAASALRWLGTAGGNPFARYRTATVDRELESLIADFRPDVAVVEALALAVYAPILAAEGARVVLSAHNVESALQREILDASGGALPAPLAARLAESVERFEREAVSSVDQIWACSEQDAELIRSGYPDAAPARVVANSVDVDAYDVPAAAARRSHSVVFPAHFAYPPNSLAAVWLARELLPLLERRFPGAEVVLAGGQPTSAMLELAAAGRGVSVTGAVPDIRPHLARADAMAVPLFQGGGTRFKVLEAFASRLPLVSTAKGVDGLDVEAGAHFLAAETPAGFAEALRVLWTEPGERERIVDAGLRLVRERYSWDAAARQMEAGVDALLRSA